MVGLIERVGGSKASVVADQALPSLIPHMGADCLQIYLTTFPHHKVVLHKSNKVVLHKPIHAQTCQPFLYLSKNKGHVNEFVRELTSGKRLYKHFRRDENSSEHPGRNSIETLLPTTISELITPSQG